MDLSIIDKTKNLRRPYVHVAQLDIANAAGTDTAEIRIQKDDIWIHSIYITGYDSAGLRLDKVVAGSELFKMSMYDDTGTHFQVDPLVFQSYNKLHSQPVWRGFIFRGQSRITIDLSAIGFPAAGIITYPARFKVHLFGYRLNNYEQKNQAAEALARIKQPYSYTTEFSLAKSGTATNTIDIGSEDVFIESVRAFGLDTAGNVLENITTLQDILAIKLYHGEEQFTDGFMDIMALNEVMEAIHWKGWFLERQRTLTIEAQEETFPAAAAGTFPKRFQINFTGYKLK